MRRSLTRRHRVSRRWGQTALDLMAGPLTPRSHPCDAWGSSSQSLSFPALLGRNKSSSAFSHPCPEIFVSQSTVPAAPHRDLVLMSKRALASLGDGYVPWPAEQLRGGQPRGVTYALGEEDGLHGTSSSSSRFLLPRGTLSLLPGMLPQLLIPSAQVTL